MRSYEFITEKWSKKYKSSINCSNPKGFSQRAHCQGRKKNESIEPSDVHKLADKKNVSWDNDPKFLKKSKELTGVGHLDKMNQSQLEKMISYLKGLKENSNNEAAYSGNIGIMELIKFFKEYPQYKSQYYEIKEKQGAIAAMKFALEKMKVELVGEPFVAEDANQKYLWHGSRQKIPVLEPRQAIDTGGAGGSNQNAIYATSDPKVAIAMGLTTAGSDTGMFPNDPQMVLFSGKIRKGENVYLHKLPMNGPDGKPQFVPGGNSREFHSIPTVKSIRPIEIKEVPVNQYLNLIRQATPKDLELRDKYMKQGVAEGSLNEASSDEAWELVGQPVPEIQQFVKQMGYGNDEQSVAKISAIIDRIPSTQIPAASIPKLKNLANKGNDIQTLKAVQQISGKPDAEQQYTKLMQARDAGEGRNRDVSGYIQYVKSGNYDPPVLLKLPTGVYVIGGRTRLYAALALGVPASVKIISANNFKQGVAENFADGKVKGKSRPGRVKRAGASCSGSVSDLRSRAKNASGEKARMYHWCANMKSGNKKK